MDTFGKRIRPAVDAELHNAMLLNTEGRSHDGFRHLERAHVLGQASTAQHVRVHVHMLVWGWKQRSTREVLGQLLRIVGAATKTAVGWIPAGNTGGSNVSPFKPMPIPQDLAKVLERAQL